MDAHRKALKNIRNARNMIGKCALLWTMALGVDISLIHACKGLDEALKGLNKTPVHVAIHMVDCMISVVACQPVDHLRSGYWLLNTCTR